jgi:hypothetical protein
MKFSFDRSNRALLGSARSQLWEYNPATSLSNVDR